LGAIFYPETYKEPLLEAKRAYHFARSQALGELALSYESSDSRFSQLGKIIAESKQAYHKRKARKAAAGLLELSSR
jgi:hypothetical protein